MFDSLTFLVYHTVKEVIRLKTRIKQLRQNLDLTQDEFGGRIGITKSSISTMESGRSNPSEQTLRSMCREFGASYLWLTTGEGPMFEDGVRKRTGQAGLQGLGFLHGGRLAAGERSAGSAPGRFPSLGGRKKGLTPEGASPSRRYQVSLVYRRSTYL